ncbi:MAG: hypothetical protein ACI4OX_05520 [Akkermansia sp.]
MLDRKALPLIFDEAEPGSNTGRPGGGKGRMESILELIRSVATEYSPSITQSGPNGAVVIYKPLFCSILFSVNNGLERETDISRFIVLNLPNRETRAEREARYKQQEPLKKMIKDPEFTPRLLRRVLERHDEIQNNAAILKRIIKATLTAGGGRHGGPHRLQHGPAARRLLLDVAFGGYPRRARECLRQAGRDY